MAEVTPYIEDVKRVWKNFDFTSLKDSSVLVTGATGLIGGCLVDVLMHIPAGTRKVYALGRNEERARKRFAPYWKNGKFHFIQGDVTKPLSCNIKCDYIVHAASNASPNFFSNQPVEVIESNILGVKNLMEYGLSHGMKRMLYVSSGEVYGEGNGEPFIETDSGYVDCATIRACYPSSKRAAETLCIAYAAEYGADVVIARPCHTYGPFFTENDNRAYAQFIRKALKGEDIILKSAGNQLRSWIYVVDCVSALLHVLLKGKCCEAYNVADEKSCISIRELAKLVAAERGLMVRYEKAESANSTPIVYATFSNKKLCNIGWRPAVSLVDGIRHTLCSHGVML